MRQIQWVMPVVTCCSFPITSRERIYNSCVRSAMLHTCETCALTLSNLQYRQHHDCAMIRWMCSVTTKYQASSQDPLGRMQLDDLAKVVHTRRLRWHSHVERSDGWLKKVEKLNPIGGFGRRHPKKTWTKVINKNCLALGLTETPLPTGNLEWWTQKWCQTWPILI